MQELINHYDKLILGINKNIKGLKIYPKILNEERNHKFHLILNKMLHNSLVVSDILVGLKYLDLSNVLNNSIERAYFARIVALNSYEILINSGRLTGNKDVKEILKQINDNKIDEELKQIKIKIQALKEDEKYLKEIRTNIIAHKDENPFTQIQVFQDLEPKRIFTIGNSIFKLHLELNKIFLNILNEIQNFDKG
ncbi:hypothetical protein [Chryseobacterium culicis]|uniref:HEPN AbiU2-like domain-containing protein n=1 Tax=Chryseobacterium culicis TaxID=680127 RepID=A0A1H6I0S4_CHRCI|nr:hypothetical protein [Chryseobacterium culicis]SEH41021.1 hypothetical protein SAMN05421593_3873 [Chryseobacterium culicis]